MSYKKIIHYSTNEKLIKEYSQNKDKEASGAHNSDVDDESSTIEQPEELSDDYLRNFSILF
jgi:hypothetical protein